MSKDERKNEVNADKDEFPRKPVLPQVDACVGDIICNSRDKHRSRDRAKN